MAILYHNAYAISTLGFFSFGLDSSSAQLKRQADAGEGRGAAVGSGRPAYVEPLAGAHFDSVGVYRLTPRPLLICRP